jgi:proteasome lid subunit RPN8/RPN11
VSLVAEIVLADLLAWMPSLCPVWVEQEDQDWLAQPISWAVAVRSGTPLLPSLRGGEMVIVSPPTLVTQGIGLTDFVAEVIRSGCGAIVVVGAAPAAATVGVPFLSLSGATHPSVVEGEINRLLTEQRGLLYSRGTDLGRALMTALSGGGGADALAAIGAEATGLPMVVEELGVDDDGADHDSDGWNGSIVVHMGGQRRLAVGPFPAEARAYASLAAERVGEAIETAIRRADLLKPRGRARSAALSQLLLGNGEAGSAMGLGLTAGARFRVAIASSRTVARDVGRGMGVGVVVHEVDAIDGEATVLIEWRHPLQATVPSADPFTSVAGPPDWLAVSGESDLVGLIKATEQARFVASLLRAGDIPLPVVAFDAIGRLGIHWLLFHLRNDPMLSRFTDGLLSRLREEDRRGYSVKHCGRTSPRVAPASKPPTCSESTATRWPTGSGASRRSPSRIHPIREAGWPTASHSLPNGCCLSKTGRALPLPFPGRTRVVVDGSVQVCDGWRDSEECRGMVRLSETLWIRIVAHLTRSLPEEGCGLLAFRSNTSRIATAFYDGRNIDRSPTRFTMDLESVLRALLDIEAHGWVLGAIVHSHPSGPATPSPTDLAEARYPGVLFGIVAMDRVPPDIRFWRPAPARECNPTEVAWLLQPKETGG